MSLVSSLSNALGGLRSNEAGLDTISRNISSAGVQGYARRRVSPVELGQGGVVAGDVQRMLDATLQRQMRAENGGQGFTAMGADYLSQLDARFGEPGSASSLDTLYNGFTNALQALQSEPANTTNRNTVISTAKSLASRMNTLSRDIQSLRTDTEAAMSERVNAANSALQTIERIEKDLQSVSGGHARADLLDERDRAVDALSKLIDIRVTPRGGDRIAIYTTGGAALFTGKAGTLTFEAKGPLNPASATANDPAQSTVADLGLVDPDGGALRLRPGLIRGGEIAGLMALRDETLPALQKGLDSLAAGLANATSEAGVPMFVDLGNGTAATPFTGGAQEVGFSQRIGVDPNLVADPSALSPNGSPSVPTALLKALNETSRNFTSPTAGTSGFIGTVGSALRNLIEKQASQASEAVQVDQGQQVVVNALNERFSASSGVSVDEEMAQLVDLQNAYAANARVVSTVRDMFDVLMRM